MTQQTRQLRAVLLTAVMVLSVIAAGVAFTGGVAAHDTGSGENSVTPTGVTDIGVVTHTVDFNVSVDQEAGTSNNVSFLLGQSDNTNSSAVITTVDVDVTQDGSNVGKLSNNDVGLIIDTLGSADDLRFAGTVTVDYSTVPAGATDLFLNATATLSGFNNSLSNTTAIAIGGEEPSRSPPRTTGRRPGASSTTGSSSKARPSRTRTSPVY
jgi:hypothetical protein